ncbi:hypothetical protein ACF06X_33285 [Streptomyces sp. NPDC015346]|uniref:hypothetical protein n=1 Tax=Streptomyces sp. NPDC015346 TaxID=3364954 RepID=UPI0036FCB67E
MSSAWARPYTGIEALAVFYNGDPAVTPPAVPTPAEVAARAQQHQKPGAPTVVPPEARVINDDRELLIDKYTGQPMTQGRFSVIMTREKDKGRAAALRELCEASGLPFDPDNFDPKQFGKLLKGAEETRKAQLSEEQRRAEELNNREQELAARLAAAEAKEQAAATLQRETQIRAELVRLGATGDDLEDAFALVKGKLADDADAAAITAAAAALKERRGALFGGTPAPQSLPPAPGGAPAGGPPARTPVSGKDAVRAAARARAIQMGLRSDDAA